MSQPADASLRTNLRRLYSGADERARRFRLGLLVFDIATILAFIAGSFAIGSWWQTTLDLVIALLLLIEFSARVWIDDHRLRFLRQPTTWADIAVILSLLLPLLASNLLFLRVLRAMRLFHSYHVLRDLRAHFALFRQNEEMIDAALNLAVFVFVTSALVFSFKGGGPEGINNYVDALYFTVTTLTTTGFGDIVMKDTAGRLMAVAIMIIGFTLFYRLVMAMFRPAARKIDCPDCGLERHEFDAVHCKRCGHVLHVGPAAPTL
jgi:voltage-gated potassium channel